jgi:hypothetical protein
MTTTQSELSLNVASLAAVVAQQLLALYTGHAPALLALVALLVAGAAARRRCVAREDVIPVDEHELGFQDRPHCPRCLRRIEDERCFLRHYRTSGGGVHNSAGYAYCQPCDEYWPVFECAVQSTRTAHYNVLPRLEKQWAYDCATSPDGPTEATKHCPACGRARLHTQHVLVERRRSLLGSGLATVASNRLSVDECQGCERRQWVSATSLAWIFGA